MVFKLVIKPIAWLDVEEAIDWYENESNGLGKRFFQCFEAAKDKILIAPERYKTVYASIKRILIKNFPYKIFYSVQFDTIFILGVTHGKRSNAFVRKRLKQLQ